MAKSSSGSGSGRRPKHFSDQPQPPQEVSFSASGSSRFQQPTAPGEEVAMAFGAEELSDMYGVGRELIEAQRALEADLSLEEVAANPQAFAVEGEESLFGKENILGTGIGVREREKQLTGEVVLKVYVRRKERDPKRLVDGLIPAVYAGIKTDVEEAAEAIAYDTRFRPAPCGTSVGLAGLNQVGTIGCLGARGGKCVLLSNNHVLANVNRARRGDSIVQPGAGQMPRDWIGFVEEFVPLDFSGRFNSVDCAIAWVTSDGTRVVPNHTGFTINPQTVEPRLGMAVKKEGRTTGATMGVITVVNFTLRNVGYNLGPAHFRSTVVIRNISSSRSFSQPGDSGSLIVEQATNRPVGLLFAGNGVDTYANPINLVMQALSIEELIDRL